MVEVAVTGGTGFLGSHLVPALRRQGWTVTALARSAPARRALEARGCRVVEGDLRDERSLAALVDGARLVFHLGGLVAAASDAEFRRVNAGATAALTRVGATASVHRMIYVSSLAAVGPAAPGRPLREDAVPRPLTPYGRSKLEGERAVRAGGIPFTIVRPPLVYGPGDRQLLRVFRLARRRILPVFASDAQELSLVYAADLADALIAAATHAACEGRTYHAVHSEIVTQRRLGDAIAAAVGRRALHVRVPASVVRLGLGVSGAVARMLGRPTLLSRDKADELLAPAWTARGDALARDAGWTAATALDVGLATTARWYSEAGWL